jgi:hypothetical protein
MLLYNLVDKGTVVKISVHGNVLNLIAFVRQIKIEDMKDISPNILMHGIDEMGFSGCQYVFIITFADGIIVRGISNYPIEEILLSGNTGMLITVKGKQKDFLYVTYGIKLDDEIKFKTDTLLNNKVAVYQPMRLKYDDDNVHLKRGKLIRRDRPDLELAIFINGGDVHPYDESKSYKIDDIISGNF